MKTDIHPQYQVITFTCACGGQFVAGSTIKKEFKTEVCSQCHPFYTGKQKLMDTSGRVDKFMAKMKKAQVEAEKKVKKVNKGEEEDVAKETAEMELEEEIIQQEEEAEMKEEVVEKPETVEEILEEEAKEEKEEKGE